jgi:hypothetical protein
MKSIMKWLATLAIAMQIAFGSYASAASSSRERGPRAQRAAERQQPFQVGRPGEGAKRGWFSKSSGGGSGSGSDDAPKGGHSKGKRPSTEEKHQKGDERRKRDQGGEKGDARRKPNPNKRR